MENGKSCGNCGFYEQCTEEITCNSGEGLSHWKPKEQEPKLDSETEREFDEKFKCINFDCDNDGTIPEAVMGQDGLPEWEARQCQFCFEFRFPLKKFIALKISQALTKQKEDILKAIDEEIKNTPTDAPMDEYWSGTEQGLEKAKQIIERRK